MPKNIVVFSDGTGQNGGQGFNTNIYKMFNIIEDRTLKQVAFYDPGLGTGLWHFLGQLCGLGIEKNIKDCYRFIFENYESGDRIFLLGFSRGAATVRSLSSFIHHFGILPASRPELIDQAYSIYKSYQADPSNPDAADEAWTKKAQDFLGRHHTMWTKIDFLGCYDSVAALGFPVKAISQLIDAIPFFKHSYHSFTLAPSVVHARHALAIDEERKTFAPILWDAKIQKGQTLKQVWFCGVHTDVGGGYQEQDLAGIPLCWVMDQAVAAGLLIYDKHGLRIVEDANGFMHDSRAEFPMNLTVRQVRRWDRGREKPVVHASVLARKKNKANGSQPAYAPWITKQAYKVERWVRKHSWQ
jgi:uncharacterized protein (DUF2235 family)